MSRRRVLVIDAHPDPEPGHFVHALAREYAEAAEGAGHEALVMEVARLDFPMIRKPAEWMEGEAPPVIVRAQNDIEWADHVVILYPLWLGDVPALLKAFLEQVMRPGFALEYRTVGLPLKLLQGRSARVVVTMGMPALFYRFVYSANSLKSLERNILKLVGFRPVEHTIVGGVQDAKRREQALAEMRELGAIAERVGFRVAEQLVDHALPFRPHMIDRVVGEVAERKRPRVDLYALAAPFPDHRLGETARRHDLRRAALGADGPAVELDPEPAVRLGDGDILPETLQGRGLRHLRASIVGTKNTPARPTASTR